MYELLDVNQKLTTDFFKTIALTLPKKNWDALILVALKTTIHNLHPTMPFYLLQSYMEKIFQSIHQRKKHNIHTRGFINEEEAIEVWHNTYDEMIEELSTSNDIEDKLHLDLIYYIYDMLKYDQVTVIDDEKYLSSYINLSHFGWQHYELFETRVAIEKAKSGDKNIDIATNRGKTVNDRVKFLKPKFEVDMMHPSIDSKESELQMEVVKEYCDNTRMMARSIHYCAEISKHEDKHFEINAIGKMKPYVNSDMYISKADIYNSWYAYVIGIYKHSSHQSVPIEKALEVARLSSYYLFPSLRHIKEPIVPLEKAKQPIRERSIFNGFRLHEFTDKRLKINRSEEEIEFTEHFLKSFTNALKSLSKS
ncbi:hypothetical protein [Candidatus Sulfurimonas baltica]|uniref:Uncharacterized protein n=1 Tax=Candidatus Sulfurimonas baltica TaxID=2740404 RepID=A0A7S7LU85_9BACT|nr:hypothetical protein [Candidatus Sulfurimonas baltica]QOY51395.1 hypothetical protein HUE88_09725 [Candidatus Sulfurimonas baltica]